MNQLKQNDLSHISCFIFDLDGTLYCGDTLFDGVIELFQLFEKKNIPYFFLTNNSSKSGQTYVQKLNHMGLPWITRSHVITSNDILIDYAKNHHINSIYLVGTPDCEQEWKSNGIQCVQEKNHDIDAVVIGFDTSLTYTKIEIATHYARKGVPVFATNEDLVCPMPKGEYIPDCGSITKLIETASGTTAQYFGKPQLYAVEYISKKTGYTPTQLCMVGDRLYTDMKMADHGLTTILVLTGETTSEHAPAEICTLEHVAKLKDLITSF
jgi:4-nitrophenyl phosphatase